MKKLILLLLIVSNLSLFAQTHIRVDSRVEEIVNISNPEEFYTDFHADIFLKRKWTNENKEKLSYSVFGIFKRDSTMGFKIGYDFDLMSEHFEKSKGNTFRHWNRFRARIDLVLNDNPNHFHFEEDILYLFDTELSLYYLHIPNTLRGDQTLSHRRGYLEMRAYFRAASFDNYLQVRFKPFGNTWIKAFYDSRQAGKIVLRRYLGLDFEIQTNPKGYKRGTTTLSKDIYKGFSFVFGAKFDLIQKNPYAYIGICLGLRNH